MADHEEPSISSTLRWQSALLPPSVTETTLDEAILTAAGENWRKTALIIASVAQTFERRGIRLDVEIIGARIKELATTGRIDSHGNLSMWRHSEVRAGKKTR
jgi:hypothetical protein